jgi:hypothetical protein
MPKAERDFEVSVTWDQRDDIAWHFYSRGRFVATRAEADAVHMEELNFNGYLDPGREDIRNVTIEKRYRGRQIDTSDQPCSPEHNKYWLGEVRKKVASCTGPLANALKTTL